MNTITQIRIVWKPLVFALCLVPAALVVTDALGITGGLGVNQVEDIQDRFGNWGLRFIAITLAVTPLRQLTGRNWLIRFRRMLGLFAFFYVLMHFLTWLLLDQSLLLSAIGEDILERPFITLGFLALILLAAMAATSPLAVRRRMGRRWQTLHNGVYLVAVLGVVHFWWQVKLDAREPLLYAAIMAVLLGFRLHRRRQAVLARVRRWRPAVEALYRGRSRAPASREKVEQPR